MIHKVRESWITSRAKPASGVFCAILVAVFSETILREFLFQKEYFPTIARITIIFLSLWSLHRFSLACFRSYRPLVKDMLTLVLVMLFVIICTGTGRLLTESLVGHWQSTKWLKDVKALSLQFAIPYAAGSLLLQALLGLHMGLIYAVALSVIVAIYSPTEPIMVASALVPCLIASLSLNKFRSRSAYLKAGLNISAVVFPIALASIMMEPQSAPADILIRLLAVLLNGIICSFLAAGLTPVIEHFGGYVTDMRLIEMATLDHPLLKELSVQCPGTWNHSMVMGMMVESAADAVSANTVLSRVGAYFHDIGKTRKPLYFVENQIAGENRHDKLSPSMSALIIRSHVKDGIELAKKYSLPKVIEDMIPQHHGTSLIEYFYDKALKEAEENQEDSSSVDQSLYSYPGPRPQTKEAGILMLADGIEAAARTLSDPSLDRIQGMVQKMINKVFASGELDECELTLKDLHAIAKAFTRVLTGIYHQRVAYAEPAEKISETKSDKIAEESKAKIKDKETHEEDRAEQKNKEDLKRLGL